MKIVFLLSLVLLIAGLWENYIHQKNLHSIAIRIHVNGIRGKSTTTRLIAGGLREAGFKVMAKTTGTAARLIYEDGSEVSIRRRGRPRIIEQRKIVAEAAKRGVQVLVIECMAVHPEMQSVAEHRLIHAHIGVITNVREDHLDQMGSTLEHVAQTLALTIPENGHLVTSETQFLTCFQSVAERCKTTVYPVDSSLVSSDEMAGFSYLTFAENVACALKVCELLNVPRERALHGIQNASSDPGVMRIYTMQYGKRRIYLANAMAANDHTSTRQAWEICKKLKSIEVKNLSVIGVLNNRSDRLTRIRDLVPLVQEIPFKQVILIGQMKQLAKRFLKHKGFDLSKIQDYTGRLSVKNLLDGVCESSTGDLLLFAFGNIKGPGEILTEYFERNGDELR